MGDRNSISDRSSTVNFCLMLYFVHLVLRFDSLTIYFFYFIVEWDWVWVFKKVTKKGLEVWLSGSNSRVKLRVYQVEKEGKLYILLLFWCFLPLLPRFDSWNLHFLYFCHSFLAINHSQKMNKKYYFIVEWDWVWVVRKVAKKAELIWFVSDSFCSI
jgi:hypothetical protein